MIGLILAQACVPVMAFTFASPAVSQEIHRFNTVASNGVVVSVITIERARRREFYSPVLEGESTDVYASRSDVGRVAGPLQLKGTSYFWGPGRYYHQARFANGDPAVFKLGPVEVRQCDPDTTGQPHCMWSEDFTITITPEEVVVNARDGLLELEVVSSLTADVARITIPVAHVEAVIEVADAR